jgi:hypothetical protein
MFREGATVGVCFPRRSSKHSVTILFCYKCIAGLMPKVGFEQGAHQDFGDHCEHDSDKANFEGPLGMAN